MAGLEGVGVVADCVFKSFTELENNLDAQPKLSGFMVFEMQVWQESG